MVWFCSARLSETDQNRGKKHESHWLLHQYLPPYTLKTCECKECFSSCFLLLVFTLTKPHYIRLGRGLKAELSDLFLPCWGTGKNGGKLESTILQVFIAALNPWDMHLNPVRAQITNCNRHVAQLRQCFCHWRRRLVLSFPIGWFQMERSSLRPVEYLWKRKAPPTQRSLMSVRIGQ